MMDQTRQLAGQHMQLRPPGPRLPQAPHLLLAPWLHQDFVDGKVEQQRVLVPPRQLVHQLAALCGGKEGVGWAGGPCVTWLERGKSVPRTSHRAKALGGRTQACA